MRESLPMPAILPRRWPTLRRCDARRWLYGGTSQCLLAAAPLLSATLLARILGIAVKNAIRILDELRAAEIAVEVTHRSKRRLFGLKGLAPLREIVRPPYRPDPGHGRGRPRLDIEDEPPEAAPLPLPPLTPIERRAFDYTALEAAMAMRMRRSATRAECSPRCARRLRFPPGAVIWPLKPFHEWAACAIRAGDLDRRRPGHIVSWFPLSHADGGYPAV